MSETVELSNFEVHNKFNPRMMEKLALQEWIRESRRSRLPGTAQYGPKEYPTVITADKIVFELENLEHRIKRLEESTVKLGERIVKLIEEIAKRIARYEAKQEELELSIGV